MSSPVEDRKAARRPSAQRDLAPHVEEAWAEDFVVELRLAGVSGARIGAALSEVESHCVESGLSAQEAFGDPADYAGILDLPVGTDTSGPAMLRSVAPTITQSLGMLMLLWGFAAWREGSPLEITTGHFVAVAVFLLAMALLVKFADPVLRLVIHHAFLLWLAAMAFAAATLVSYQALDSVVWRVKPGWALAAGIGALVAGMVGAVAHRRAQATNDGPVTSPFAPADQTADPAPRFRAALLAFVVHPAAMVPTWTLIMLASIWWLTR